VGGRERGTQAERERGMGRWLFDSSKLQVREIAQERERGSSPERECAREGDSESTTNHESARAGTHVHTRVRERKGKSQS